MTFKLGKLPARIDLRTIKLMSILKDEKLPPIPDSYSYPHPITLVMWGNDQYGDCVEVGSANWQTRAEVDEQKVILPISTKQVVAQYFLESGFVDSGLNMLDHLRLWKRLGLAFASKLYQIDAYASINPQDINQIKAAVAFLGDAYMGFQMPDSWEDQINAGKVWDDPTSLPNPDNGHCMVIRNYNKDTVDLITWGQVQKATWRWISRYCDEAYAIVDQKDRWVAKDPINVKALEQLLAQIEKVK